MTRIIGGLVGSRKLISPAKSTRPTSDRIRESVFNSLESRNVLVESSVLDLYAGTGALGLEALSRGAKLAVLVENNKQAAGVCIKNSRMIQDALEAEGQQALAKVEIQAVQKFLDSNSQIFDLVFIDPPYETSNAEVSKNLSELKKTLSKQALVVVERSARSAEFSIEGYKFFERRDFGDTAIYWLRPN